MSLNTDHLNLDEISTQNLSFEQLKETYKVCENDICQIDNEIEDLQIQKVRKEDFFNLLEKQIALKSCIYCGEEVRANGCKLCLECHGQYETSAGLLSECNCPSCVTSTLCSCGVTKEELQCMYCDSCASRLATECGDDSYMIESGYIVEDTWCNNECECDRCEKLRSEGC